MKTRTELALGTTVHLGAHLEAREVRVHLREVSFHWVKKEKKVLGRDTAGPGGSADRWIDHRSLSKSRCLKLLQKSLWPEEGMTKMKEIDWAKGLVNSFLARKGYKRSWGIGMRSS